MSAWVPPPLPPRLAASRQLPLVGRRQELAAVRDLWAEVEQRRRQVVLIGGEPGGGKTRLVAEIAGALHDDDVAVLVGTSAADVGVPYQPFVDMFEQLFSQTTASPADLLDEQQVAQLGRLSSVVTREASSPAATRTVAGQTRRELFDAVVGLFRRLSADRPLTLIFDDVHWAQLPTLALLDHVVSECADTRLLVLATFRTTAPDRSADLARVIAELHRLDGVRRLDLDGLDVDAIAEYVSLRGSIPVTAARAPAGVLRELTGGNPFMLREMWTDLEHRGGVGALRHPNRVPASIADSIAGRLAGTDLDVRENIELAAVLGDSFDLATLVSASEAGHDRTMAFVDAASALGLIEPVGPTGDRYSFVHSLTREAVLDRLPPSRLVRLHARAAAALERQPARPAVVTELANHYLAAYGLGYHTQALHYTVQAGRLAERGLAFEEAALWFERAAALPACEPSTAHTMQFSAAADWVRAGHFPSARAIYEQLATTADPVSRVRAAIGYEDTNWRPGRPDPRAVDLLTAALHDADLDRTDPLRVNAYGSLGRALTFAGERARARDVGRQAIELARQHGDDATLAHALAASLWHGITPDMAAQQLDRIVELTGLAARTGDDETLGTAANFLAMVSYVRGDPAGLERARADVARISRAAGQPYYRHVYGCIMQARAFMRGEFSSARRWAVETLDVDGVFGDDMTDGPHGVQMFMIHRETGGLDRFGGYLDGSEAFDGRWVPALLALYTELGIEAGMARALDHLLGEALATRRDQAQWPMELAFLVDAALRLGRPPAIEQLRPLVEEYAGQNLASGALIAVFGSADRLLGRIAAFRGDHATADHHFGIALGLDTKMHSVVHVAETLAHHALAVARTGDAPRAAELAQRARALAEPIGQVRVLRMLDGVGTTPVARAPDELTGREIDVLKLLAAGLSNREIGARLHISANTAANHVRSILTKTGAANRTQAAIYATRHRLA